MVGDAISPPQKKPSVKTFNCPSCGANVIIRAVGQTLSVSCGSCHTIIDTTNENFKILNSAQKKMKTQPLIPLGTRGKLHGTLWEVIGFLERCDGTEMYFWREYLLFNPLKGFRWLTEFDGHWNYVVMTKGKPKVSDGTQSYSSGRNQASYLNSTYYLFHRGKAKVKYVLGEFYWKVAINETVDVEDYVAAPEMLSKESTRDEVVWSLAEYVPAQTVQSAFNIKDAMPLQHGVAPNQPSSLSGSSKDIMMYWAAFICALFLMQFAWWIGAKRAEVYSGAFTHSTNGFTAQTEATPSFDVRGGTSNLEIKLTASVSNSWLEVQGDLVNDETGETIEFEQGVEYYSGYDYDGSWSEGSQTSYKILSSIPAGKYHFNLETSSGFSPTNYELTVRRNVPTWSNFLWALALVSLCPVFVSWRGRAFEMNRWSQSDFSPYYSHNGEDD